MNKESITELTIICLSLNRQPYLRRQIAYFYDFPITLVILDASHDHLGIYPETELNGRLDLRYHHMPGKSVEDRLKKGLTELKTKYVCFLADDDVLIKSGLTRAVEELEVDPEIKIAGGKIGKFVPSGGRQNAFLKWGRWSEDLAITDQNPKNRLIHIIKHGRTANIYYIVLKTELLQNAINKIKFPFSYNSAFELLFSGTFIINSKYKMGSYPFWLRGDVPSISYKSYSKEATDVYTWFKNKEKEVNYIAECLFAELVQQGNPPNESREAALEFLQIHRTQSQPSLEKAPFIINFYKSIKKKIPVRPILANLISKNNRIFDLLAFIFEEEKINKFIFFRRTREIEFRHFTPDIFDILIFWKSFGLQLRNTEEADLIYLSTLLSEFPEGIHSNKEIFNFIKKMIVKK